MKKVLSVLVILGFVIGMAACGNKAAEEAEAARIQDSIEQAEIEAATIAEAEALAEAEAAVLAAEEALALAEAEAEAAATPTRRTTTQKPVEEVKVDDEPKTKTIRGGGTSGGN